VEIAAGGRKGIRYPLQGPAIFDWKDATGIHHKGEGRSRDISEGGAFVLAGACPLLKARVNLVILLPPFPETIRALRMEVEAQVIRVEQAFRDEKSWGFAVASKDAILRECDGLDAWPSGNSSATNGCEGH